MPWRPGAGPVSRRAVPAGAAARAGAALLLALPVACGGEPATDRFAPGEEIPLGILQLTVERWEESPRTRAPLRSLHPPEAEKPVVVFVRWRGLGAYGELDRRVFVEAFLEDRLTLVDAGGGEHEALTAMPRDLYHGSAASGWAGAPPDWVVVFWVPADRAGYSLRIEHPDPAPDGFRVAVVDLP